MASIRTKQLTNGKSAYLVRFRTADGHERSRQFARRRDAEHFAHLTEVDRAQGSFVDPRLGKITVAEWFERWWPTVTNLRPTTRARDEASFRTHIAPTFGTMQLARVDRTSAREWAARLSDPDEGALAPATVAKAVQVFNKLMRAAVEDRVIAANPVERLPLPRIEPEEMRFLTADTMLDGDKLRFTDLALFGISGRWSCCGLACSMGLSPFFAYAARFWALGSGSTISASRRVPRVQWTGPRNCCGGFWSSVPGGMLST